MTARHRKYAEDVRRALRNRGNANPTIREVLEAVHDRINSPVRWIVRERVWHGGVVATARLAWKGVVAGGPLWSLIKAIGVLAGIVAAAKTCGGP